MGDTGWTHEQINAALEDAVADILNRRSIEPNQPMLALESGTGEESKRKVRQAMDAGFKTIPALMEETKLGRNSVIKYRREILNVPPGKMLPTDPSKWQVA